MQAQHWNGSFYESLLYVTGAPAYLSFPHFYQADPALLDAIEGLKPNKEKHQTYFLIQPVSSMITSNFSLL
jgi:hypothetical protein